MTWRRILGLGLIGVAVLALLLWIVRARLAAELTRSYFQSHGIASSVRHRWAGLVGRLGPLRAGPRRCAGYFRRENRTALRSAALDAARGGSAAGQSGDPRAHGGEWLGKLAVSAELDRLASRQPRPIALCQRRSGGFPDGLARFFWPRPMARWKLDGDLKLVRNLPVSAAFTVRPASLRYGRNGHDVEGRATALRQ